MAIHINTKLVDGVALLVDDNYRFIDIYQNDKVIGVIYVNRRGGLDHAGFILSEKGAKFVDEMVSEHYSDILDWVSDILD